jgi:hypothetical protein
MHFRIRRYSGYRSVESPVRSLPLVLHTILVPQLEIGTRIQDTSIRADQPFPDFPFSELVQPPRRALENLVHLFQRFASVSMRRFQA